MHFSISRSTWRMVTWLPTKITLGGPRVQITIFLNCFVLFFPGTGPLVPHQVSHSYRFYPGSLRDSLLIATCFWQFSSTTQWLLGSMLISPGTYLICWPFAWFYKGRHGRHSWKIDRYFQVFEGLGGCGPPSSLGWVDDLFPQTESRRSELDSQMVSK